MLPILNYLEVVELKLLLGHVGCVDRHLHVLLHVPENAPFIIVKLSMGAKQLTEKADKQSDRQTKRTRGKTQIL